MVKIIENCCSPMMLEFIKYHAQQSENWNFKYPMGASTPFEDKHAKLEVICGSKKMPDEKLSGMAAGLLINIYEKSEDAFIPDILFCGISLKDIHRKDNTHKDHHEDGLKDIKIVKLLGVLNSDWQDDWGGGFIHGDKLYPVKPTDFLLFDPKIDHKADDILVDKKRLAIDFTVRAK